MKALLSLVILMFGMYANSQSIISTYASGDIPTSFDVYDATCTGPNSTIVITLPPVGLHTITSIDVSYDFTATGNAWIEDQRSQIHCQNTILTESIFSGSSQVPGTEYYNRTSVNIANGEYSASTNMTFEMRAWRVFQDIPGCTTDDNKIDDNTWSIVIHYTTSFDVDGDGYETPEDCDDTSSSIYPGASEVCDGIDNDCDGLIDDEDNDVTFAPTCWTDEDNDGQYGTPIGEFCTCPPGSIDALPPYDCDESNPNIYPGAPELCDGIDNDCDGDIDEGPDLDGDGSYVCDCDDTNPNVYPDAPEVCDGIDNDCDGLIDDEDNDVTLAPTCWTDEDGDGNYGTPIGEFCTCPPGSIDALPPYDCDDYNPTIYNDAPELCDGIDNDCDGDIDEGPDLDGDGSYVCDCDDTNPNVYPGAPEVCDGIDNDCDGLIDDEDDDVPVAFICYSDEDSDGFPGTYIGEFCICPPGSFQDPDVSLLDCDDSEPSTNPNAPELCDGIDNDCDGDIDEDFIGQPEIACNGIDEDCNGFDLVVDTDGDGYTCDVDCDDTDSNVNPGMDEDFSNGIDDNCDGLIDEIVCFTDADGDGYGSGSGTIVLVLCSSISQSENDLDCDDSDLSINPAAEEICGNAIDEDCNGILDDVDADNDGWTCDVDCDDNNLFVNPSVAELCYNAIDDNCDGVIDEIEEGNPSVITCYIDLDGDGHGDGGDSLFCLTCPTGYALLNDDCDDNEALSFPGNGEVCDDGIDNNCDGQVDEINDQDADNDFVNDLIDNCPCITNVQQSDVDGDGIGDLCDSDFITNGNVGIANQDPLTRLHITDGEVFIDKNNGGIIMKVDSETCWRLSINAEGAVNTVRVDCPE